MTTEIINVLKKYIDNGSINELLLNCYKTVLEHKFKIIAHFYFLIEKYVSFDKVFLLKNISKKWVLDLYYENYEVVVQESKKYIKELILKNCSIIEDCFDFSYDKEKVTNTTEFLKLQYEKGSVVDNSEQEKQYIKDCSCNHVPCTCIEEERNKNKYSFSDSKNASFGSTNLTFSHNNYESRSLLKLHNKTKYQEKYQQKYDNNKEEVEFIDYFFRQNNFSGPEKLDINKMWTSYKTSKMKENNGIKIRNKNIHFLYICKIVTNISYENILQCVSKSSHYTKKINLNMLYNFDTYKLHTNIESSFDKFFSSVDSVCVYEYKKNHEENKKIKYIVDDNIYNKFANAREDKIQRIKKKISFELTNPTNLTKNNIYDTIREEGLKITKKDIELFVKRVY